MVNLPRVALGAGFVGAVGNKLATVEQKPALDSSTELPAVSEKCLRTPEKGARLKKGGDLRSGD